MFRHAIHILAAVFVAATCSPLFAEIRIGVQAPSGPEKARQDWKDLAVYLSERMGDEVVFVPVHPSEFREFCDAHPQGFLFHNPWVYIRAQVLKGARALVTVKYEGTGSTLGGVVFARRDSGINYLPDVRDKVLLCFQFGSLGGWLMQKNELVKNGITPEKDCRQLLEAPDQTEVVYAVRDKRADVGTVRTGILERMHSVGKIDLRDFRVLNEIHHEGFPQLCSTPLYPEAAVAALRETPPEVAAKMRDALLSIPSGHPALRAPQVGGFVPALDYGPVEEMCKRLGVEPFGKKRSQ